MVLAVAIVPICRYFKTYGYFYKFCKALKSSTKSQNAG